jgi:type VI protein secretion system component VasF
MAKWVYLLLAVLAAVVAFIGLSFYLDHKG